MSHPSGGIYKANQADDFIKMFSALYTASEQQVNPKSKQPTPNPSIDPQLSRAGSKSTRDSSSEHRPGRVNDFQNEGTQEQARGMVHSHQPREGVAPLKQSKFKRFLNLPAQRPQTTESQHTPNDDIIDSRASVSALSATDVWLAKGQRDTTLRSSAQGGDSSNSAKHTRELSLEVNYTTEDVQRMAEEIYEETTADVHLSLFAYWIRESGENFASAKKVIRELSLDQVCAEEYRCLVASLTDHSQGYNIDRIRNSHLRKLLTDTHDLRPKYVPLRPLTPPADVPLPCATPTECIMFSAEALDEHGPNLSNRQRYDPRHGVAATAGDYDRYGRALPKLELLPASYRDARERVLADKKGMSPAKPANEYPPNSKHN